MDYEKKYKEALERAKRWAEGTLSPERTTPKGVCEVIFPELAESEDERIKEKILECVSLAGTLNDVEKARAYLEKQKEQKSSDLPAGFYFIDQDGNKYYSKEFRYNNGTFTTTMKVMEEQKPAWQEVKGRRGRIGDTPGHIRKKAENFLSKMEPPYDADDICSAYETGAMENAKPAGWSEEDERTIRDACCWIAEYAGFLMSENKDKAEMLWKLSEKLKSLCPQYHGDVTMTEAYKMGLEAGKASSWKPSEEQMSMLLAVIRDPNNAGSESCHLALESLLEDLTKL